MQFLKLEYSANTCNIKESAPKELINARYECMCTDN